MEQFDNLIEFRQAIYDKGFTCQREVHCCFPWMALLGHIRQQGLWPIYNLPYLFIWAMPKGPGLRSLSKLES